MSAVEQQYQSQGTVLNIETRSVNGSNGPFTAYKINLSDGASYDTTKADHVNKATAAQTQGLPVVIVFKTTGDQGQWRKATDLQVPGLAAQPLAAAGPAPVTQTQTVPILPAPPLSQAPAPQAYTGGVSSDAVPRISRGNAVNAAADFVGNLFATGGEASYPLAKAAFLKLAEELADIIEHGFGVQMESIDRTPQAVQAFVEQAAPGLIQLGAVVEDAPPAPSAPAEPAAATQGGLPPGF